MDALATVSNVYRREIDPIAPAGTNRHAALDSSPYGNR